MQIYDTKTKEMREMTTEEIAIAESMPDPNEVTTEAELLTILLGGAE